MYGWVPDGEGGTPLAFWTIQYFSYLSYLYWRRSRHA